MKEDWPGNSPDVNTEENILDDKLYADREVVKMEQKTITDTESYQLWNIFIAVLLYMHIQLIYCV